MTTRFGFSPRLGPSGRRPRAGCVIGSDALQVTPFGVSEVVAPQTSRRTAKHRSQRALTTACSAESVTGGVGDDGLDHSRAGATVLAWPQRCCVRFDDTAGAFTVDDAHDDSAGFWAGELGEDRDADPAGDAEGHGDDETVVLVFGSVPRGRRDDLEMSEGIGVEPRTVPRVEPIGDDVGRFADPR